MQKPNSFLCCIFATLCLFANLTTKASLEKKGVNSIAVKSLLGALKKTNDNHGVAEFVKFLSEKDFFNNSCPKEGWENVFDENCLVKIEKLKKNCSKKELEALIAVAKLEKITEEYFKEHFPEIDFKEDPLYQKGETISDNTKKKILDNVEKKVENTNPIKNPNKRWKKKLRKKKGKRPTAEQLEKLRKRAEKRRKKIINQAD